MPVLDGYQVLKKIKDDKELNSIPVIMFIVKGWERDLANGIESRATDYIIKPFRPAELAEHIK